MTKNSCNEFNKTYCLRAVLKSKFNAENIFRATNICDVPMTRYDGGIIQWTLATQWTKEKLSERDRKMRKLITKHGGLHSLPCVGRLKEKGKALVSCFVEAAR